MPGLSSGINIGLTGLQATQSALNIIGHNIANVNTPGYSRQRVSLQSAITQQFGTLQFGTGVSMAKITGIRDRFLDLQISAARSKESGASTRYEGLEGVNTVFLEEGEAGMNNQIRRFFQGFQELALRPEDAALRMNLVGRAQNMINGMQTRYRMLEESRSKANTAVISLVSEVNTLTTQISELNKRISSESTLGSDNDARDQRKALLDQLATKIGIQVYEDDGGLVQVTVDGGSAALVAGLTKFDLTTQPDPLAGNLVRVQVQQGATAVDITSNIQEGEMGAHLDLRDNLLADYQRRMDEIAAGVVGQVNLLHRAGFGLNGSTNVDFFLGSAANGANGLPTTVTAATNYAGMVNAMQVNAAVVADPRLIAASNVAGAAGNNVQARAMAALADAANTVDTNGDGVGDSGPFSSVVGSLVNTMGTNAQNFSVRTTTAENLSTALERQRERVSGVDLDEEAAALIMYQRGYQASSRFVNVIAQLTDQLVNQFAR